MGTHISIGELFIISVISIIGYAAGKAFYETYIKKSKQYIMSKIRQDLVWEKIGYDWANKKMLVKVYDSLQYIVEHSVSKPTWTNVIKHMFVMHNDNIDRINVNGYYSTIRRILKDIKVIEYYKGSIIKGSNWDRFYGDEDWSWFKTNTNGGGYGEIINGEIIKSNQRDYSAFKAYADSMNDAQHEDRILGNI